MIKLEQELFEAMGFVDEPISNDATIKTKAAAQVVLKWINKALLAGETIGKNNKSAIYQEYDEDEAKSDKESWLKENGLTHITESPEDVVIRFLTSMSRKHRMNFRYQILNIAGDTHVIEVSSPAADAVKFDNDEFNFVSEFLEQFGTSICFVKPNDLIKVTKPIFSI